MAEKKNDSGVDEKNSDSGEAEVQAKVDAENEVGYRGTAVDKTPRENYTLAGQADGKPTPESERGK